MRTPALALLTTLLLCPALASCGTDDACAQSGGQPDTATDTAVEDVDTDALDARVADYQAYLVDEATTMITATQAFTDAVRAGDVAAAKSLYAASRYHWETIEPLAGLVASVDGAVDSRVDDFASVDDPSFTGWHRLEHALWEDGRLTRETDALATRLDRDLAPLPDLLADLDLTAADVATGAAGLIEEVSEGKITGEEDRYSHTDLYDLAANVNGSLRAFQVYEPVLAGVDNDLENAIEQAFTDAKAVLADYQRPDGSYASYLDFAKADKERLQAILAAQSEDLSRVQGVLGL